MFQTLVRRYQSRIFTAAFRILSNSEEAEEVVQDTFMKVHQNISKFRQQASFSSWVFKIAHNQCMDILRNRQRRKGFRLLSFDPQSNKPEQTTEESIETFTVISQLTDPGADPSQSMELSEQGKMVTDALKQLTDTQRTVVVLHDIEGFQYQEIAEIVGTSIGTVRSRLHYGRVKLKELLEPIFFPTEHVRYFQVIAMSNDFNCEQLEPLLSAYHDGELTAAERADAERHLNGCAACQNRLLEISAVAHSLKSLPRLNPKTDVAANIEQLIANQPKRANQIQRPVIWGAAGIAAAAAVLIVASNFKSMTGSANHPLTANSKINQTMPKHEKNAGKSQDLEIAQGVEPTSNLKAAEQSKKVEPTAPVLMRHEKPSIDHNARKNSKFNPHLEIASKGDGGTTVASTLSGSHTDATDPQLIANRNGAGVIGADSNLVAVYDTEQRGVTEELGITTDEDGLYAIKL